MGWRLFPPAAGAKLQASGTLCSMSFQDMEFLSLYPLKKRVKTLIPTAAGIRKFPAELTSLSAIQLRGVNDQINAR